MRRRANLTGTTRGVLSGLTAGVLIVLLAAALQRPVPAQTPSPVVAATPAPAAKPPTPAPTPSPSPKPAPEDPEVKMGREAHEELLKSGIKLIKDPAIVARVETIGRKIAAVADAESIPANYGSSKHVAYDYKYFVVDDNDVNAFSLPGGYIYINKGAINYAQTDDELAAVIGHETTHAMHHHVARLEHEQSKLNLQMALGLLTALVARVPTADAINLMTGFQLVAIQKVNGFGQDAERDADHGGVILMKEAGYNPVGALTFMERLERDEQQRPDVELGIFRTHPPSKERAELIEAQIKAMGLPINRRAVTTSMRVTVRPATSKSTAPNAPAVTINEVLLDGSVIYRTPSTDRAKATAAALDHLLDEDLQIYDLSKQGATITARGETILSVQPEDMAAYAITSTGPTSPEAAADTAYKTLRNALYRHLLNGNVY